MTDRYAVIGNPIAHSKSPLIHAAFALETGQDLEYSRILGDPDDFPGEVSRFLASGGRGLNVTVPFKEAAFALAEEHSPAAASAGAVNTLTVMGDGRLRGDNTDGVGLVRDLAANHGFAFHGKRVLLLGAGGAARGVLRPLLETGLASLTLANRTAARADELLASFMEARQVRPPVAAQAVEQARGHSIAMGRAEELVISGLGATPVRSFSPWHLDAGGFAALAGRRFDLIINATSAGLGGAVPGIPADCLSPGGWTYDLLYGDQPTTFCRWGRSHGAALALDGLGMLVEQAAESFWLWRGLRPSTGPVIAALRQGRSRLPEA